ncbi:MAG: helix-turn-helix transcriptional regulator [Cyclobacteriaceae bacterium]
MNYQTYPTRHELEAFVKCYWTLQGPKSSITEKQTIVPDGCIELIFHFGDRYRQYLSDGTSLIQPHSFVMGQLTQTLEIAPTGMTDIFAVRFYPHGFAPFSSIDLKTIANKATELIHVFGDSGKILENNVRNVESSAERISIVETFLLDTISAEKNTSKIIQDTVDMILEVRGHHSLDELSQHGQIGRRQLERKFASEVGLSPKYLSRVVRLQAALQQLLSQNHDNLTSLAYKKGYYDQAHFIKDFKAFTGPTPKAFYADSLKLSGLFYGHKG